jgi:hypothetical protein
MGMLLIWSRSLPNVTIRGSNPLAEQGTAAVNPMVKTKKILSARMAKRPFRLGLRPARGNTPAGSRRL